MKCVYGLLLLITISLEKHPEHTVFFQKLNVFQIVRSKWFVSIVIDMKPYMEYLRELDRSCIMVHGLIDQAASNFSYKPQSYNFSKQFDMLRSETVDVRAASYGLQDILREINFLMSRPKRSLLPFVGKLSSFLFGTVSESQLKSLRRSINELSRQQMSVVHVVEDQITIMNRSRELIAENRRAIKKLTIGLRDLKTELDENTKYLFTEMTRLFDFVQLYNQLVYNINKLKEMLQNAYLFHDHLKSELNILGTGKISPEIITPKQLRKLLDLVRKKIPKTVKLPFNAERRLWPYYEILQVGSFIDDDKIVVVLTIPLREHASQFELHKVLNLEVALKHATRDLSLYMHVESPYFAIDMERTKFILLDREEVSKCQNPLIAFCEISQPLYSVALNDLCVIALFLKESKDIDKFCHTMINLQTRFPLITEISSQTWAVATKETIQFAVVCYVDKPKTETIVIKAPLGLIHLNSSCSATNNRISLIAGTEQSISYDYSDPFLNYLRKVNFTRITLGTELLDVLPKNKPVDLPPMLEDVKSIEIKKLIHHLSPPQDLGLSFFQTHSELGIPGIIAFIVLLIALILFCKYRKRLVGILTNLVQKGSQNNHTSPEAPNGGDDIQVPRPTAGTEPSSEEMTMLKDMNPRVHLYPRIEFGEDEHSV